MKAKFRCNEKRMIGDVVKANRKKECGYQDMKCKNGK